MTHNKNDSQKGYTFARSNLIAVFLKWTRLDKRGMLCFSWPAGSTLQIDEFQKLTSGLDLTNFFSSLFKSLTKNPASTFGHEKDNLIIGLVLSHFLNKEAKFSKIIIFYSTSNSSYFVVLCRFWIHVMAIWVVKIIYFWPRILSCQKLGIILENKLY